jgi:hypothetical protein
MTEPVSPAAIAAIVAKRDSILKERARIRAEAAALSMRDRELDRELADCRAAARLFGAKIDFPTDDSSETSRFIRNALVHASPPRIYFGGGGGAAMSAPPTPKPLNKADATAVALSAIQEALNIGMPRVSDIVLDRLKKAAEKGSKASPMQTYIESTYGKKIHDKTVGMTLYRLQKEGLVRRDGHTWFITEKGMNPGVAAPGLINKAS